MLISLSDSSFNAAFKFTYLKPYSFKSSFFWKKWEYVDQDMVKADSVPISLYFFMNFLFYERFEW